MGRTIDLFKEPLIDAVARYHGAFDPDTDDDPLLEFGAVGGKLAGVDPLLTIQLRDALIRYDKPHLNFEWECLQDLIEGVLRFDAAASSLVPLADPDTQQRFYCLNLQELSRVAHAVVVYQFLYSLERSEMAPHVRFALGICETLVEGKDVGDQLSSVNSTISDVCWEFGTQHPLQELSKMLLHKDYALEQYYKQRDVTAHPTLCEPSPPSMNPFVSAFLAAAPKPGPSAPPAEGTQAPAVRFAPLSPSHVSVVRSLPGQGLIPDTFSSAHPCSITGGPSVMRVASPGVSACTHPGGQNFASSEINTGLTAQGWTSHAFCSRPELPTTGSSSTPNSAPDPEPSPNPDAAMEEMKEGGAWEGGTEGMADFPGGTEGAAVVEEEGDSLAAPGEPASATNTWQLNYKLNVSVVPSWNGRDETIIDFVVAMAGLVILGPRMAQGIAHMALSKFTAGIGSTCLGALRRQFLTKEWVLDRTQEFEEMKFRQKGCEEEAPLDFYQQRLLYHSFIFADQEDGPSVVARVLRTQPAEWTDVVNELKLPTVDSLLNYAQHGQKNLATRTLSFILEPERICPQHCSPSAIPAGGGVESGYGGGLTGEGKSAAPSPKVPWPGGKTINGYEFACDDSRVSPCPPNGECYICTSPKHLARDCSHYGRWLTLRNANLILVDLDPEEEERDNREYLAMIAASKSTSSRYLSEPKLAKPVKEAFVVDMLSFDAKAAHFMAQGPYNRNHRRREAAELTASWKDKGKATTIEASAILPRRETRKADHVAELPMMTTEDGHCIHSARKVRQLPDGLGSLGSRALHVKVKVGSLDNGEIRGRLDSGADITLMSEEFWESIPSLPKLKEGIRMTLYHLTGQAKVLGYIKTQLYMVSKDGEVISFELEAYVVRNMKVPLLLGEDFQSSYELGVRCWGTGHCDVQVRCSRHIIPASSAHSVDLGFEIQQASMAKTMKRPLPRSLEKNLSALQGAHTKRGESGSSAGPFEGKEEWMVEKVVIATEDASVLAAPTTLIRSDFPLHSYREPQHLPLLHDPAVYADALKNQEEGERMAASAEVLARIIQETLRMQDSESLLLQPVSSDDQLEEDLDWGPKTTALAGEFEGGESHADVAHLVNLGPDIPEHIRLKLDDVLRHNAAAFGVGGRLGHVKEKAPIPVKPGTQPVSIPMYSALPVKREVIDKQMDLWFERDVIEPSSSPWGAPCVVVFHNGKPRLVVDYRKLNAATIADEFPIPCQSEIIQALSGSQVLSSFDALAGFNQVEMDDDTKEKTAFRSHRGLWQFKRMPFGLRNGPSIFQRIMQGVLAPYLWLFTLIYIDDIVVFSRNWEDHLVHLGKVLSAIAAAGITLEPKKCFIGYSSILLLGQKVSRLGLSTHKEKVAAIQELERPSTLAKGVKWEWRAEHEIAFLQAKDALSAAPILGHPIQGTPYRLYTDASDFALGSCLQQVQPIQVADLRGTTIYDKLKTAWDAGQPVLKLFTTLTKEVVEMAEEDRWGASLDETTVHVERVITYWSRSLKSAERNYSATEREVLGAKEALVRFQPFIEGEQVVLVTDHAALQWACVYENANRRLAAWGAVFAAYPGLKIVHRPGRVHSNVDPLSRLPRAPPHESPVMEALNTIVPDEERQEEAQRMEDRSAFAPAKKAAFAIWWWEDVVDKYALSIQTRRQKALLEERDSAAADSKGEASRVEEVPERDEVAADVDSLPFAQGDHWTYPVGFRPDKDEEDWNKRSHLLISVSAKMKRQFKDRLTVGYCSNEAHRSRPCISLGLYPRALSTKGSGFKRLAEILPYRDHIDLHHKAANAFVHSRRFPRPSEDLRTSLKQLPFSTPSVLRNGLIEAHRKLSDYYYKMDQSPYYTWAALLDPRISYEGLKADFNNDENDLMLHLEASKTALNEHLRSNYALRKTNVVPTAPPAASSFFPISLAHHRRTSRPDIASSGALFWTSSGSTTAFHARILPFVILFSGGFPVKPNFRTFFVSLAISSLFLDRLLQSNEFFWWP
ncbi:TY3B-TY3B protein [Mycena venus]|uniref:RNA-directed DNA polymerase n=1 Tax=Mycena venus TaxID=2733690 RepID=A0A8H7CQN9_9AGAR|nr:TY3B-TY3B protein [Mycena venus]